MKKLIKKIDNLICYSGFTNDEQYQSQRKQILKQAEFKSDLVDSGYKLALINIREELIKLIK